MSQTSILITGATGYIGGRLVPRLLDKGRVRCLARRPENLQGRDWSNSKNVEIVAGDLLQPETLEAAFVGIDVAYYLVHSMAEGEKGFDERDRIAARNFAEAAKKAGVRQIIYLGGLGEKEAQLSPHLKSRQEVGDILRESGVPVTEFRGAIIVGSGSISFEMIRYLTERVPIMVCPRWVQSRCQPISIRDILAYLITAIETPAALNQIIEIGGADVLTYAQMMLRYAKIRKLKRYLIRVPVLTPHLSSYWVDLVTPIPSSISRPLIEGLKNDVVCLDRKAQEIFPQIHPMGYDEAVILALQRVRQGEVETSWAGASALLKNGLKLHTLKTQEGLIIDQRKLEIRASAATVYKAFSSIGGTQGWLYANWAWKMRGILDRIFGGIGMRRGRRHPERLLPGDVVDWWRVEELQPDRLLRLRAEMKVPGKAWLQFEVLASEESPEKSIFIQTALFDPRGLAGILYWYFLYPIHNLIFAGLARGIKKRSEEIR